MKTKTPIDKASLGAMIALFIATLFILQYILSTQIGYSYFRTDLIEYIIGMDYGMKEVAAEMLFVVVTRLILAFGLLWWPITAILSRRK